LNCLFSINGLFKMNSNKPLTSMKKVKRKDSILQKWITAVVEVAVVGAVLSVVLFVDSDLGSAAAAGLEAAVLALVAGAVASEAGVADLVALAVNLDGVTSLATEHMVISELRVMMRSAPNQLTQV
jgi:hypothetical protein